MDHVTHYTDLAYFASGSIAVCCYRLFTLSSDPTQVIIQIDNCGAPKDVLITDHIVRDGILNRIADRDLTGIPCDMLCVALTEAGQHHIAFVEADLEDYIHRGYPYERSAQPAARGRHIDRISINSRDLVVGRARLQTARATPTPAADRLAAILDRPPTA
ncbi:MULTISPECIES: hypothetical protein [unclassified Burkholderia]|uniref:hypothetical protein n=1 Tax=unclassified Burkholderia TaxID=2613784 RepID=UPI00075D4971|nr:MULTISPECIES: hypothetical protein [unclassified Burkholderia]KUY49038.1 hypothetical protein WS45_03455 [Burkholderia sp. RF2-non_BP3]KUY85919.1 hypothetical protein WS46_05450 [Burkholderia sp. RF4-BP95]